VCFLRIGERRITATGRGIVCYISNYSYIDDPSFVVARQRLSAEFDTIWIDCMNGDSRETGKLTPDGRPDPSIFSTPFNREGIRLGTAIGLFVRQQTTRVPAPLDFFCGPA
jgi:predicted helicase